VTASVGDWKKEVIAACLIVKVAVWLFLYK
jgi:hypothetical protein